MRILTQRLSDGSVEIVEAPAPQLPPGFVRVRTIASCISPGTEGAKVITGKKSLLGKARAKPEQTRQVLDMVGQIGLQPTIRKVRAKLAGASPLGYSSAGLVVGLGDGAERFEIGDLVACAGGGYANHADEVVVPANLAAKVPDGVPAEAAAMTTLGAIALQGIRLAQPTVGENAVVIGLGLIGLMACQLLKANGCRVFGVDVDSSAVERARGLAAVHEAAQSNVQPIEVPPVPNAVWGLDFMSDTLYGGRRFRTLNILDGGVREALDMVIDTSIPAARLVRVLDDLASWRGIAKAIRCDNGPEILAQVFVDWCEKRAVEIRYIQPGKPNQNAYVERFNRTYQQEVLNAYLFGTLGQVRVITREWMREYNERRPHDALGRIPPSMFRRSVEAGISTFALST